ncbi:MAG: hypothetical protein H6587_13090 [Flavobacteriales bacterium]|nr:hypothetical protein [Flavobacteriales bacterium]
MTCLAILPIIYFYSWWFLGTLAEFKEWYANFGIVLWLLKQVFSILYVLILAVTSLLLLFKGIKHIYHSKLTKYLTLNFSFFFLYVSLSLIIGEEHPFSIYPLYDTIFKGAKIYYFTDQNSNHIPNMTLTNTHSQFIDKIYKTYCDIENTNFDKIKKKPSSLNKLGDFILQNTVDTNTIIKLSITMLNFHIVECYTPPYRCDTTLVISKMYD